MYMYLMLRCTNRLGQLGGEGGGRGEKTNPITGDHILRTLPTQSGNDEHWIRPFSSSRSGMCHDMT